MPTTYKVKILKKNQRSDTDHTDEGTLYFINVGVNGGHDDLGAYGEGKTE